MNIAQSQVIPKTLLLAFFCLCSGPLTAGTEGTSSTFYGQGAGASGSGSSAANTFIGLNAGANTSSTNCCYSNTFVGAYSGQSNSSGYQNAFLGYYAGLSNTTGHGNTFLGNGAGADNISGHGNVYVGYFAGSSETGANNKLYIDNCYNGTCDLPLIYGEFDNNVLKLNGATQVAANGVAKSQMHFSLNLGDPGGWLTSVLDNNFFVSSGARYDAGAGGWIQRSSDGQAVIAGSGNTGYRIFTHTGTAVGSTFAPTLRLHIDYSGQIGINTAPVAGHEIHTSSGAYLSGGTWTDASSREYKDRITPLTGVAAAQTLAALKPVTFVYKNDTAQGHVGFIAEDVPDLVATRDRKGLSPMDIVAVLTKVVQQQAINLDEKTTLIEKQQKALTSLERKVARLERERHIK